MKNLKKQDRPDLLVLILEFFYALYLVGAAVVFYLHNLRGLDLSDDVETKRIKKLVNELDSRVLMEEQKEKKRQKSFYNRFETYLDNKDKEGTFKQVVKRAARAGNRMIDNQNFPYRREFPEVRRQMERLFCRYLIDHGDFLREEGVIFTVGLRWGGSRDICVYFTSNEEDLEKQKKKMLSTIMVKKADDFRDYTHFWDNVEAGVSDEYGFINRQCDDPA